MLPRSVVLARYRALAGKDTITWLGQSTFLIRVGGRVILTDPFLGDRAGVFSRFASAGIWVNNLPPIDVIVVSHNHYDHLDASTVEAMPGKDRIRVFVPLKLGAFFTERGYAHVRELDWGDTAAIDGLRLTALPAVHGSGRGLTDENATLWAARALETTAGRIFFAGDTGYSPTIFRTIGARAGPFLMALLPISAYAPAESQALLHATPEQAVAIGREVGAAILVASHWGTIDLSDEPIFEPPQRFRRAGRKAGYPDGVVWVMAIGETRLLPRRF